MCIRDRTLTTKEQSRIQVLNGVIEGKVTVAKAAGLMGVSERHAWRLLAAYREEGLLPWLTGTERKEAVNHHVPEDTTKSDELIKGPGPYFGALELV